jgi:cell division protein FtsA
MAQSMVLGLDIGSWLIKAVVAEAAGDKLRLLAGFSRPSAGLRRGVVVEMEEVARNVNEILSEVKTVSRAAVKNIYLNVGCSDTHTQVSRGIIAVARANSEIHEDDIERVIQASQAINLPQNRMILHAITREFIVDGVGDIKDPLGMLGSRLEVSSLVVDTFAPSVKNLMKCVDLSGGSVSGLILNPLAASRSILSKNQKELGVVLIDIGFNTTGMAVYEEDKLVHTAIFPVGAGHITNDLAIALKIPVEVAEKIKIGYGYALAKDVPIKENIDLKKFELNVSGSPSRRFVAEVVESRTEEILDLVNNELKLAGKAGRLPAGAVLSGGGAKLPGIVDLCRQQLKLSTQIGLVNAALFEARTGDLAEYLESPEYAVPLGLILWSRDLGKTKSVVKENFLTKIVKNLLP